MTAADTSVKNFRSTDAGAPVLTGLAGTHIAILDACLCNGYNLLTASSVVVSAGVATATFASAHGYRTNAVLLVAGATPAGLNGEKRVISATSNALTFDATGIADGAATGAITAKMAPAGFGKSFTGTNKAVYRSADLLGSSRAYLRVDDSATLNARAISYEAMTDVDTGSGPVPTTVQLSGGVYLPKSTAADATARKWYLVADGRFFYLWVFTSTNRLTSAWGEFPSYRPADGYNTGLFAQPASSSNYYTVEAVASATYTTFGNNVTGASAVQRGADAVSQSVATGMSSLLQAGQYYAMSGESSTNYGVPAYPDAVTGGFVLSPVYIREGLAALNSARRGVMPGLYHAMTQVSTFAETEVSSIPSMPGKTLLCLPGGNTSSTTAIFIDLIGPWR